MGTASPILTRPWMTIPTTEVLQIALVIPLQGPAGIFGPSCEACAQLAVDEINSGTGVLGRELHLIPVDGGAAPHQVAPIRATSVKRAYEPDPVTTRAAGPGLTVLLDPCSQLPVLPPRGQGQAGAPAAAQRRGRTSLTPASGGRSSRGEEGLVCGWLIRGRVGVPGAWRAEWSRKHPSGAAPACGRLP